jgi:hypothetical protein
VVTLLFAAWLIDTWTRGGLVRAARQWWADVTPEPLVIDFPAAVEATIAEAIGYTRIAAGEV